MKGFFFKLFVGCTRRLYSMVQRDVWTPLGSTSGLWRKSDSWCTQARGKSHISGGTMCVCSRKILFSIRVVFPQRGVFVIHLWRNFWTHTKTHTHTGPQQNCIIWDFSLPRLVMEHKVHANIKQVYKCFYRDFNPRKACQIPWQNFKQADTLKTLNSTTWNISNILVSSKDN